MNINQARLDLATSLGSTGIHVALDPKKAHAPCILVGPVIEVEVQGLCMYQVTVPLYLIAPAPGDNKAVTWLAEHITDVLEAADGEVTAATLGTYDTGQGDLPTYEATATIPVKE